MSEIKGQLLGIILVLAIFGAVGAAIYKAYADAGKSVSDKINVETIENGLKPSPLAQPDLLTFEE